MLKALLKRLGQLILDGSGHLTGLAERHPLRSFIVHRSVGDYLWLDDACIWGSLSDLSKAKDEIVSLLALRLACRRLYKCVEVGSLLGASDVAVFKGRLAEAFKANEFGPIDVLPDTAKRNPYKRTSLETPEILEKVLIRRSDGTGWDDLRNQSEVVDGLRERTLYRVYVRDATSRKKVQAIVEQV
jgi:hypothetical protein